MPLLSCMSLFITTISQTSISQDLFFFLTMFTFFLFVFFLFSISSQDHLCFSKWLLGYIELQLYCCHNRNLGRFLTTATTSFFIYFFQCFSRNLTFGFSAFYFLLSLLRLLIANQTGNLTYLCLPV